MTRDEIVVMIQQVLGFRTDLTDAIVRNIKSAQTYLELGPTKPWFLLSEESQTTTDVDSHRVLIPTDFLCEYEDAALVYRPTDNDEEEVILGKRDYDWLLKAYPRVYAADAEREPKHYCLRGDYFLIFPRPDAEYIVRMVYYKKDAVLTSDIENKWTKHVPLLIAGMAGKLLAPGLRDGNATAVFVDWERTGRNNMFTRSEDRDHTGRDDYQMGGPE